jgi:serine/threonine protein kinase
MGVLQMAGELGGRYRLLEVIGSGGMGRVWRADDTLLQRTVAIKELAASCSAVREARAAARLDHPGAVRVYDVLTTEERAWIVMEHVPSRSLYRVVTDDGPLSPAETARIGLSMLAALGSAHAAGVLHRDVKPDNVLLAQASGATTAGPGGRVVLADFGLATISGVGPDPRLGSPGYIAPERLLSREAGVAGDLWSLAATLYFAVEGRSPYTRGDGGTALRAMISEPPDPTILAGPLAPLLLTVLDRDPARRPSAAVIERGLREVLDPPAGPRFARRLQPRGRIRA